MRKNLKQISPKFKLNTYTYSTFGQTLGDKLLKPLTPDKPSISFNRNIDNTSQILQMIKS